MRVNCCHGNQMSCTILFHVPEHILGPDENVWISVEVRARLDQACICTSLSVQYISSLVIEWGNNTYTKYQQRYK